MLTEKIDKALEICGSMIKDIHELSSRQGTFSAIRNEVGSNDRLTNRNSKRIEGQCDSSRIRKNREANRLCAS